MGVLGFARALSLSLARRWSVDWTKRYHKVSTRVCDASTTCKHPTSIEIWIMYVPEQQNPRRNFTVVSRVSGSRVVVESCRIEPRRRRRRELPHRTSSSRSSRTSRKVWWFIGRFERRDITICSYCSDREAAIRVQVSSGEEVEEEPQEEEHKNQHHHHHVVSVWEKCDLAMACGIDQGIQSFLRDFRWCLFGRSLDAGSCGNEYHQ